MEDLKAPEPRRRTLSPSALVAALAQAVIEQHAKRAGLATVVGAMSVPMERDNAEATSGGGAADQHLEHPALTLIAGGRGTRTEP
jgi:hypothetical protein